MRIPEGSIIRANSAIALAGSQYAKTSPTQIIAPKVCDLNGNCSMFAQTASDLLRIGFVNRSRTISFHSPSPIL